MKLHEVTCQDVDYKQSMGMRFRTEARVLKSFCRMIGDVDINQVQPAGARRRGRFRINN